MAKPGQRTWTDEQLASTVEICRTWSAVAQCLGLRQKGETTRMLRRHAARLQLDVTHMPKPRTEVVPLWSPAPGESAKVEYLDVDPDNANTYVQLGRVYHAAKNYKDSRRVLEEAVQIVTPNGNRHGRADASGSAE